MPRSVHIQQHFFGLGILAAGTVIVGIKKQLLFFAVHADRIEFFEAESDGIDQVMAARAGLVGRVDGEALAIYTGSLERQQAAYRRLIELLTAPAAREYYRIFPARKKNDAR